jgi:hypothetical protein
MTVEEFMKFMAWLIGGMIAMTGSSFAGEPPDDSSSSTIIRNGDNVAVVTQSGDPSEVIEHVVREPGRTIITRKSGGNTTIVTQGSGPVDIDTLPPQLRELFRKH